MPYKKSHRKPKKEPESIGKHGVAATLFITGVVLIVVSVIYSISNHDPLWFVKTPQTASVSLDDRQSNQPVRIEITTLALSLPVTEAHITRNKWQVSNNGVSHLDTSAVPNSNGNIILYGHNKTSVLGKIVRIKKGDIISVKTRDRNIYSYIVEKTAVVSPQDIKILESNGKEMLTLYTCTGFADLKRFVVKAIPL